jgi:hypothetical protein
MVWSIGAVTLPFGPKDIADDSDCVTENLPLDGAESIIFATAPGIRVVTLTGSIFDRNNPTKADLETAYCSTLRGYQGTVQAVVSSSGAYTASWYIKKVAFTEQAEGQLARIGYTIIMWLGSSTEVL